VTPLPTLRPQLLGRAAPAATAVLWVLAIAACAHLVLRSYTDDRYAIDFHVLQDGATRFWDGGSVYSDPWFMLTPSGLLAMLPFGLVGPGVGFAVWNTVSICAVAVGIVCSLRFVGAPLTGPAAAGTTLVVCLSESFTSTLLLGNLNNSLLLALGAGFLLADLRGRTVLAGVLLGASLAIKPVLVLLLLMPLLRRRWPTLGWAVCVPLVLNVVGLALLPSASEFVTVTVPQLLQGRRTWNNSLWSMGMTFGAPGWSIVASRVLVLVLMGVAVWRLRRVEDAVLRSATTYGVLALGTFMVSSLSQAYYSVLLVPVLLTVVRAGSAVRTPAAWVALYLFAAPDSWAPDRHPGWTEDFGNLRWTAGWAILFGVLVAWTLFRVPRTGRTVEDAPLGTAAPARREPAGDRTGQWVGTASAH
jgi:arabinofuranan 3-O-arabinosyltransferase